MRGENAWLSFDLPSAELPASGSRGQSARANTLSQWLPRFLGLR